MQQIGKIIKERNLKLKGFDPISSKGFTQVPNFLFEDKSLSLGAKFIYAVLLSYCWHNDFCFPGQKKLAEKIKISEVSVNKYIKELETKDYLEVKKRGQGKTNIYTLKYKVTRQKRG